MGGPVQAEEGVLGGIVGATNDNFKLAEPILKLFCKNYFHFGPVGMGAKSKLLNNFLTLGNAALINHMAKAAKKFDLDLKKFIANVNSSKDKVCDFISNENKKGKVTHIYGASTKGNTILQY